MKAGIWSNHLETDSPYKTDVEYRTKGSVRGCVEEDLYRSTAMWRQQCVAALLVKMTLIG